MKKVFFKYFMFSSLFNFSCGGDGGSDDVINPASQTVDPPSVATLNSPENNKVCEEGTSVSETQSSVNFQWTKGNADDYGPYNANLFQSGHKPNNISETNKAVTLNKGTPYSWKDPQKEMGLQRLQILLYGSFIYREMASVIIHPIRQLLSIQPQDMVFHQTPQKLTYNGKDTSENSSLTYDLYIDTTDGLQDPVSSNQNACRQKQYK